MKKLTIPRIPPVLAEALKRLADLEHHPFRLQDITYNRPQVYRLMRLDRRRNLLAVAVVLVKFMDIPSGRIQRPHGGSQGKTKFVDCTLSWLAAKAGVSQRTLCRVLADMVSVGWLSSSPQQILPAGYGTLAVASVTRILTDTFFRSLGLTQLLARDREYFKQLGRTALVEPLCRLVLRSAKFKPKSKEQQIRELTDFCRANNIPYPPG